jgi:hypothetical protein
LLNLDATRTWLKVVSIKWVIWWVIRIVKLKTACIPPVTVVTKHFSGAIINCCITSTPVWWAARLFLFWFWLFIFLFRLVFLLFFLFIWFILVRFGQDLGLFLLFRNILVRHPMTSACSHSWNLLLLWNRFFYITVIVVQLRFIVR